MQGHPESVWDLVFSICFPGNREVNDIYACVGVCVGVSTTDVPPDHTHSLVSICIYLSVGRPVGRSGFTRCLVVEYLMHGWRAPPQGREESMNSTVPAITVDSMFARQDTGEWEGRGGGENAGHGIIRI